jgi:hypothetical protein
MQIYLLFTSYDSAVNYPTIQYPFNNLSLSTNASTRLKIKPEGRQLYYNETFDGRRRRLCYLVADELKKMNDLS